MKIYHSSKQRNYLQTNLDTTMNEPHRRAPYNNNNNTNIMSFNDNNNNNNSENRLTKRPEVELTSQNSNDNSTTNNNNKNLCKNLNYDTNSELDVKPTKKRYIILLLFCLHSMINAFQWIYLCSITNIVAKYYHVDNLSINLTSMIYMIVYIPLIVPASWLFEKIGMRNSILIGSLGTSIGSIIKCFCCNQNAFYLLLSGQTIVAISQLFVLSVPPRLASVWFPDNQVSLATACGVFGNQFGIAMGFVIPQLIVIDKSPTNTNATSQLVEIENGLFNLFLGIALFSSITSILIMFIFDHSPAKAPGLARLQQIRQEEKAVVEAGTMPLVNNNATINNNVIINSGNIKTNGNNFMSLLWCLLTDKNFALLMISYGLNVGVFYGISTILNQMISPKTIYENNLVGRLGLVMVISGMFGSVISGYLLDRTHKYRLINTALYTLSLLSMIIFTLTIQFKNVSLLYLTVCLLGYFMTGYLFIGFEMSNEITWPRPESVSAGLLNLSAQVSSLTPFILVLI